ncbi:MAG: hypothetical protein ACP5OO_05470 [Chloroflexia bacterium]
MIVLRFVQRVVAPPSPYTRAPEENRLAVPICHLSRFALLGPVQQVFLPLVWR